MQTAAQRPAAAMARLEQLADEVEALKGAPSPRAAPATRSRTVQTQAPVVQIGSIEVTVTPPPAPEPPRVIEKAPAPQGPLSRGYVPSFGLRQG
jgi:hypothetical protein